MPTVLTTVTYQAPSLCHPYVIVASDNLITYSIIEFLL